LSNSSSAQATLASIDDAIAMHATVVLMIHRLAAQPASSYEFSIDEFQALVDGLRRRRDSGALAVDTITEWDSD
jgi:hypothetical protein